jgi:AcrR family transcriptional regulator
MSEPGRTPQRTARRREEILETARALFESEGIARVTTGRIVEVAGISPGNLYYWFANKTEIVRALFEVWADDSDRAPDPATPPQELLRALWQQGTGQPEVVGRFAFFARELFPLLHADPELAATYRAHVQARTAALTALVEQLIDAGLLNPPPPPTGVAELVAVTWLVAETATPFAEAVGAGLLDPHRAAVALLVPQLTARGREALGLEPLASSR